MVTFERIFSLRDRRLTPAALDALRRQDWYLANGTVYGVLVDGELSALLYWAMLGCDGIWPHLAVLKPGTHPLKVLSAVRVGMGRLLSRFPLVICQAEAGSRMESLLAVLGFERLREYEDPRGRTMAVHMMAMNAISPRRTR